MPGRVTNLRVMASVNQAEGSDGGTTDAPGVVMLYKVESGEQIFVALRVVLQPVPFVVCLTLCGCPFKNILQNCIFIAAGLCQLLLHALVTTITNVSIFQINYRAFISRFITLSDGLLSSFVHVVNITTYSIAFLVKHVAHFDHWTRNVFVAGVCNRSYGLDVARIAGLPGEVIRNAEAKARRDEQLETIWLRLDNEAFVETTDNNPSKRVCYDPCIKKEVNSCQFGLDNDIVYRVIYALKNFECRVRLFYNFYVSW